VMKGGRLYDAATLDELWPQAKPRAQPWFHNEAGAQAEPKETP
jgi:hypothetical protein